MYFKLMRNTLENGSPHATVSLEIYILILQIFDYRIISESLHCRQVSTCEVYKAYTCMIILYYLKVTNFKILAKLSSLEHFQILQ